MAYYEWHHKIIRNSYRQKAIELYLLIQQSCSLIMSAILGFQLENLTLGCWQLEPQGHTNGFSQHRAVRWVVKVTGENSSKHSALDCLTLLTKKRYF